jgi:hypothetical protein
VHCSGSPRTCRVGKLSLCACIASGSYRLQSSRLRAEQRQAIDRVSYHDCVNPQFTTRPQKGASRRQKGSRPRGPSASACAAARWWAHGDTIMVGRTSERKSDDTATVEPQRRSLPTLGQAVNKPCRLRTEARVIGRYARRIGDRGWLGRA